VLLIGTVGSVVAAQAWQATVNRQRDERLDRTAATRTVTITSALANYENGLQAARSLWLASNSVSRPEFGGRRFALRYAPRPGNAILTERTVPAPVVLGTGIAASVLLAALLLLLGELAALYREVGRLAHTDSLTGVANRRAWDEEFPCELARAARSGRPLCLALLDLDHFKDYNDRHGHQAGHRLLKAAAAAWQGKLRKTDLLAHYGGKEFSVLLPDCELDNAMEIAERLRTAHPDGTCSIGVAHWDRRERPAELVARADRTLYAAKEGGRNRCHADTAGHHELVQGATRRVP
jgi:diguanylate cyclase (GGDEF)-like protein